MSDQKRAFDKLSKLKVGALFMEMGTGKTKVALDLIASRAKKIEYVLWICPFSLKAEIEKERQKWHPELVLDVVGAESIGSSGRIYLETLEKVQKNKTFIVVDESLKIKNMEAKRTKRILHIGEFAEYKLILNGTPLSKNCLDLYPQFNFLSPKILNMSFRRFRDTFTEYYVSGKMKGVVKRQHNIPYLISLVKNYIFDAKLGIDRSVNYFDERYDNERHEECAEVKREMLSESFDSLNIVKLFSRLQACYTQSPSKDDLIKNIITSKPDEQFIVFVKYLASIRGDAIQGSTPPAERKRILADFESGRIRVLYMTYGVGAYGLNLQFCHNMVFADQTFDYAQKIQAEARIYRIGQAEDVNYYNLWCRCGLENIIEKCLSKKVNLLDEVKKEIQNKGVEEWLKNM